MDGILLDHYGHLGKDDIEKISNELNGVNLSLKIHDRSGKIYASVYSDLITFFVIDADTIINWGLNGASWEILINILKYTYKKVKDIPLQKISSAKKEVVYVPNKVGLKIHFKKGVIESLEYNGEDEFKTEILKVLQEINADNNKTNLKLEALKKRKTN